MGNFGCGCSDYVKDEVYERISKTDQEEIIEFHPELHKKALRSLITAVELPSSNDKSNSPLNSKLNSLQDEGTTEMQGELFRYHRTSKEILVPRWCILTQKNFIYYKNQYSALCKEKPLFDVSTDGIVRIKAYKKYNKYFVEIIFMRKNVFVSSFSSNCSGKKSNGSRQKAGNHLKTNSDGNEFQETLVFVVPTPGEWESWQKTMRLYIKIMD